MGKHYLYTTAILAVLLPFTVQAAENTHSIDCEESSSQSLYHVDTADTSLTGDLTFSFHTKIEEAPSEGNYNAFFSKGSSGQHAYMLAYTQTGGIYEIQFINWAGVDFYNHNATLTPATWYDIDYTWDASEATAVLYIDNVAINVDVAAANSIPDTTANFEVCGHPQYGYNFDGLIDDLRIYNAVLSEETMATSSEIQLNGNESNLVAYFMFNNDAEDKGEVTAPAGANTDDLTLVNTPLYSTDVPFSNLSPPSYVTTTDIMVTGWGLTLGFGIILFLLFFGLWWSKLWT